MLCVTAQNEQDKLYGKMMNGFVLYFLLSIEKFTLSLGFKHVSMSETGVVLQTIVVCFVL